MVNYQNGKIYKIVCNKTGLCYVGSTTKDFLSQRLTAHRGDYKQYKQGKKKYITSVQVLENDDYEIVLLESYPCNSSDELHARERYYIENIACVNKNIPNRSHNEYVIDNYDKIKKYHKQYVIDNYEKVKNIKDKWSKINKEKVRERFKKYREDNKELIRERAKQHYKKHSNKYKEIHQCDCGGHYTYGHKSRHLKSQIHIDYVSNK